jgi:hypothetical protein
MGMFSWFSSDEQKRIIYDETENILMTGPDGRKFLQEGSYGGYGDFGGKDFYEYVAELNCVTDTPEGSARDYAIQLVYDYDSLEEAEADGFKLPRLLTDPNNFDKDPMSFPPPQCDPHQGFPSQWKIDSYKNDN